MSASWFDGVTLTVEIGFDSNPSTDLASTTWTDVSAYVRAVQWRYGRTSEFDDITPGVASVTLDNRDRRFDPDYTSSPYNGKVLPMRRIRLRATYATVTYDLWCGFVEAWPQTYWQDADALVDVPCVDATAVLTAAEIEANAVESAILALAPTGYYPMDDRTAVVRRKARVGTVRYNSPDRIADSSGNGNTATIVASGTTFDAGYLSQTDSLVYGGQSLRLGGTIDGYGYNVYADQKPDAGPISMSLWFATTAPSGATSDLLFPVAQACADDGDLFRLSVFVRHLDDTNSARVEVTATHTTGTKYAASAAYSYGAPCFVGCSVGATGTPVIVIDGVSLGASSGFYPGVNNGSVEFGRILGPGYEMNMTTWTLALMSVTYGRTLTVDEWAIWAGTKLTAAQLQAIYTAGRDARDNERSGSRLGYILDAADWPTADRAIDAGETWLGPLATNPGNALQVLNDIAEAEQGRIFVAPNGKLTFQSRTHDPAQSSAVTMTDATYSDLTLETSRQTLRNRVTVVQESTSSTYVAEDSTSQTAYLRADETINANVHGGTYASQLAAWRLARYKDPQSRITALRFPGRKSATTITQALARQVGDLVTVTRTPQGVGSAISKMLVIEGVSQTLNAQGEWQVEWFLGPGPNTGPWLTLGVGNYDTEVLADSPVGYWKMDENSGTTAEDSSGNNRDGTYTDTFTLNGDDVTFSGSGRVVVPDDNAFTFAGSFTAEAWLRADAESFYYLVSKYGLDPEFYAALWPTTNVVLAVFNTVTGVWKLLDESGTSPSAVDGEWHHCVWRYNDSTGKTAFFVDGALVVETTPAADGTRKGNGTADLELGGSSGGSAASHDVKLVALYASALSDARIAAHYAATSATSTGVIGAAAGNKLHF